MCGQEQHSEAPASAKTPPLCLLSFPLFSSARLSLTLSLPPRFAFSPFPSCSNNIHGMLPRVGRASLSLGLFLSPSLLLSSPVYARSSGFVRRSIPSHGTLPFVAVLPLEANARSRQLMWTGDTFRFPFPSPCRRQLVLLGRAGVPECRGSPQNRLRILTLSIRYGQKPPKKSLSLPSTARVSVKCPPGLGYGLEEENVWQPEETRKVLQQT